jgi:cytochrome P450
MPQQPTMDGTTWTCLSQVARALRHSSKPHSERPRRTAGCADAGRDGDVFSSNFPSHGRVVYLADPAEVKRVFTRDPTIFHAGEANTLALGDVLGDHSLLALERDLSQRKLLLPPFHGQSVRRFTQVMTEATSRERQRVPGRGREGDASSASGAWSTWRGS